MAPKKRDELTFDDEEDDLMDALGFGEVSAPKNKTAALTPKKERYCSVSSELHITSKQRLYWSVECVQVKKHILT